jgi:2-polyprenyl-3-methyl-5-hydroxy-6-metoxy-1,4-benzoquinol methylase
MNHSWFDRRKNCPACTASEFRTLFEARYDQPPISDYLERFYAPQGTVGNEYLRDAAFVLCECARCNLIFQRDIPNDALMEKLYAPGIDPHEAFSQQRLKAGLGHYSRYAQEIMQVVDYFGRQPAALRFLDFGMGWGEWALMAKAFGCDCCGAELSQERIDYAASNGIEAIPWDEIPHHAADFINTEQVFEHLPDPLETLRHLKKGLRPGGILKISVPTANDMKRRLGVMDWHAPRESRNSLNPVAPLEHINCFNRSSLLKMAEVAGMEEIFIPTRVQYRRSTNWQGAKQIVKNFLLPIYRNVLKRQNYMFLRNVEVVAN